MKLRIKAIRESKGLTAETVAGKAGISRSFFTQIENGDKVPNTRRLLAIATALDVSVRDLLDEPSKNERQEQLMELVSHLSDEEFEAVFRVAETLAHRDQ